MRISQLSRESTVPVATIKYYLRERLLHEGQLTSATQASYDESHVRRLRLIRALIVGAGLSIAVTRDLLDGVDAPPESGHDLLGIAHHALIAPTAADVDTTAVDALLDQWGWDTHGCDSAAKAAVAGAIDGIRAAGFELPEGMLDTYAGAMHTVASAEIAGVPTDSAEAAVHYVVLGTVLVEPLLLALRRLAQQSASRARFGAMPL
ncbi:MerR-like DNA binding protein [Glaciihabitans tibetensis]|uniref:MerR-like DNA binding protein n=1 Tax=Glaciihabitans tibetensis TaxID=1266600 RepID=A0A2T0VG50_9MICO|nr:MerR family transcriptional regulator [Glaciihabitans tibetensis]PRY69142.1 MerR-like DNA binding protein [Glaciihabitans tibetensis]